MARDVQVLHQGEIVAGVELDFKSTTEVANEYTCEDGSVVKVKTVVTKIVRLNNLLNDAGEPVFVVTMTSALTSSPAMVS